MVRLIVGLGNPGEKYAQSRHNLGFMVVEFLAKKWLPAGKTSWRSVKRFDCELIMVKPGLMLAKPQTFMNASGFAVRKLADFYRVEAGNLWVIHDDLDLPLGKIKIRNRGGSAGHRGVTSVAEHMGRNDWVRFRLGIGRPGPEPGEEKAEKYVLADFSSKEKTEAKKLIKKTAEAVEWALERGIGEAMNRYNG